MAITIPETEPLEFYSGETVKWKRTDLSDYPAPTWTLYYVLQKTGIRITFNSSQDGSTTSHLISLTPNYHCGVSGAPSETNATVRQIAMSPKAVASYMDLSRKLILQASPDIETIFRNDMVQQVASAIDTVGINGGGSNEPTGILQTSGIGSVAIGTNGGAPTWASVINNIKEVAIDNALGGALAYLTNSQVVGKMRQTVRVGSTDSRFLMDERDTMMGYRVAQTSNVPSNLTKGSTSGTCSAMIFGNFNDLIIGQWSATDVLVDPYSGSNSGTVRIVVFHDVDIAVRHAESFSSTQDYTTT
jgi:HK97 family phage major capsid protein